jgi:hypothetical protein
MSICYDFQKSTMISLASVAISLTIGLILISIQYAHGQEDAKSKVDELTKNTLNQQKEDRAYKEELINRITGENSTCSYFQMGPILIDLKKEFKYSDEKIKEKLRESLGALPVKVAEATYKKCLEEGKIKINE